MSPLSAPAYQLLDSPPPTSFSPLDLIQRVHPLETASAGYLPHLLESVTSLTVSKPSISLALAEKTVFLRPPRLSGSFDDDSKSGLGVSHPIPSSLPVTSDPYLTLTPSIICVG